MPYIVQTNRDIIDSFLDDMLDVITDAGELNYTLTTLCLDYLNRSGKRYKDYNEIIGALQCCQLEFYRRAVSPYEDKKIKANGDVYE